MADSVVVRITENRLVVTKEDKKVTVAAPYVKYIYTLVIKGYYATLELLQAGVTDPAVDDAYGVGTEAPYTIYIWTGTEWKDNGTINGIKGDPGDSTNWITGTIDPTTEGIDGDLYLNYTTWHVWEKISGTWEDKGSIKGADGADGGSVPAISTGDAGKVLTIKSDESGTEWKTPSSGSSSGVSLGLVIALT